MSTEAREAGQFYKAKLAGYGNEIIVFIEEDGLQFQQLEKKDSHWQRSNWRDVTELQNWVERIGGHYTARLKGTQERITIYAVCDSYLKLTKAEDGLWFEANQWASLSQLEDFMPCDLS